MHILPQGGLKICSRAESLKNDTVGLFPCVTPVESPGAERPAGSLSVRGRTCRGLRPCHPGSRRDEWC